MSLQFTHSDFDENALPHLNSAYNLARWLTRNEHDAEDLVQEAYLRAFRFYHRFRGGDARPWLLKIVRNTYYTQRRKALATRLAPFDEGLPADAHHQADQGSVNPEEVLIQQCHSLMLRTALEALPSRSREILVLRELEGMSYNEISTVVGVPSGTVMSNLSRARARLRESIRDCERARAVRVRR